MRVPNMNEKQRHKIYRYSIYLGGTCDVASHWAVWIVISPFGTVDSDAGLRLRGLTWRECSTCARCCKGYDPCWLSVPITYPQSLFMIDAIVNRRITGTGVRTSRCCTPSGGSFAACENSWTPMGCSSTATWSGCLASLAGPRLCRLHPEWVMSWHKLPGLFVQRAPISYYTEVEAVCADSLLKRFFIQAMEAFLWHVFCLVTELLWYWRQHCL